MSAPSPPSFAQFFNQQPRQRTSSNSSSQQYSINAEISRPRSAMGGGEGFGLNGNQQYEEPAQLHPSTSRDQLRNQSSSASVSGRVMQQQGGNGPTRQESFPFDPEQATLIATAPNDGRRVSAANMGNDAGPSSYADMGNAYYPPQAQPGFDQPQAGAWAPQSFDVFGNPQYDQYQQQQQHHHHQQQQQQDLYHHAQQQFQQQAQQQQYQQYQPQQQQSPYILPSDQQATYPGDMAQIPTYGQSPGLGQTPFYPNIDTTSPFPSYDTPSEIPSTASTVAPDQGQAGKGDWGQEFLDTGTLNAGEEMNGFGNGEQDFLNSEDALQELERIISAASSQNPSRAASPFQEDLSRPTSRHASPLPSSPFIQNPSPPALIIPGNSPSPAPTLPPINTNTKPILPRVQPPPSNPGGLFPPANPALTGMAGISPIHPNADGPMIFVQPSTPISGLKEGRGVWEAALRQATQNQNQDPSQSQTQSQNFGQQHQTSVPPPQSHTLQNGQSGNQAGEFGLNAQQMRPRAKSDSHMADVDRQIMVQMLAQQMWQAQAQQALAQDQMGGQAPPQVEQWSQIDAWRATIGPTDTQPTLDPRSLPGQEVELFGTQPHDPSSTAGWFGNDQQLQLAQLQAQAQRSGLPPLSTASIPQPTGPLPSGQFSPTSMAFYQSLGILPPTASQLPGTTSAPFYATSFQNIPQNLMPQTADVNGGFLGAPEGMGPRRRSFAEGTGGHHPAAGAGTPGYGVEFASPYGRPQFGHRRGIKSEDFGRGWGLGQGGSTTDFLQSITANDGSLLPPARGRTSSRSGHSSASSARSASPALSNSSQGSSMSHHSPRMTDDFRPKLPKMKVTSMATEMASSSRRTNDGVFRCPIPGCGSTFTRHFNLKGHLRSHNDERPYKCLYDGCPKSIVGFARQHDCKRHMLLHEGLRPFECEGCGKKFARLDALTRHHKSEQGQECAISHPLPVNPDGSPMSESQYKAYKGIKDEPLIPGANGGGGGGRGKTPGTGGEGVSVKEELDYLSDFGGEAGTGEFDQAA